MNININNKLVTNWLVIRKKKCFVTIFLHQCEVTLFTNLSKCHVWHKPIISFKYFVIGIVLYYSNVICNKPNQPVTESSVLPKSHMVRLFFKHIN